MRNFILPLTLLLCLGMRQVKSSTLAEDRQLAVDVELLQKFRSNPNKNVNLAKKIATSLHSTWIDQKSTYPRLMWELCQILSSYDFGSEKGEALKLAVTYSRERLISDQGMDIDVEVGLTICLLSALDRDAKEPGRDVKTEAGQDLQEVDTAMKTWAKLYKVLDPTYDPKAPLRYSGYNTQSKSVETFEEYKQRVRRLSIQSFYYRQDLMFSRVAETYIIRRYSSPPFNLPELKHLLDKYDIGKEHKKRILDAVVAQMKYAVTGATSLPATPPQLPSFEPTPEVTPQPTPQK